jgi:hypothetical protein
MRPRVSILNLLLVTTIVALAIVVLRMRSELRVERALRIEMLKKGGIMQVSDPDLVHVVQVINNWHENVLRWRVFVPRGRNVKLSARLEPVPDKPVAPRLPPSAIVVADRVPSNAVDLGPGEHVVSLSWERHVPYFTFDVVGDGPRHTQLITSPDRNLDWFVAGYAQNITDVEHTKKTAQKLANGRTVAIQDGKTFVLCRYRAQIAALLQEDRNGTRRTRETNEMISELLLWLHSDGG